MSSNAIQDLESAIRLNATVAKVHHVENRLSPSSISSQCEYLIRPNQLPAVVEDLRQAASEAAWAVFMFRTTTPSTETTDDCLNLQFAIERGAVGLEWVLLGPRNIADKEALTKFICRRKQKVEAREMNGVAYLRVEEGDLIDLGLSIVNDFYGVASDYAMGLLVHGFLPHIIESRGRHGH